MIHQLASVAVMHSTHATATIDQLPTTMPGNPYIDVLNRKRNAIAKPQGWSDTINNGAWSEDEHARFMEALQMFPGGPWRLVAEYVGTRTVRQVQTHMQKINEKARRHRRGLHKKRKDRPRSEPIGSVSVLSSEDDEEILRSSDTNTDCSGVILEPIVLSPRWSAQDDAVMDPFVMNFDHEDELLFDDAMVSGLDVEGMEDVLNCLFESFSS